MMQGDWIAAGSGGLVVLALGQVVRLVRELKNGKNDHELSDLMHQMLVKQERGNTLLEGIGQKLDKLR